MLAHAMSYAAYCKLLPAAERLCIRDTSEHFNRQSLQFLCLHRNEVFFSNRAAAYTSLNDYSKAIQDARRVIAIKPRWAKGHSRLAAAHFALQDYSEVGHII